MNSIFKICKIERFWADVVLLNFHSYESTGKLNYTALEAMKEMLPQTALIMTPIELNIDLSSRIHDVYV